MVWESLREKCPNTDFFQVHIISHSDWIRRDTQYRPVFSPNAGKYGPEKIQYLDTFRTVNFESFAENFLKLPEKDHCFGVCFW